MESGSGVSSLLQPPGAGTVSTLIPSIKGVTISFVFVYSCLLNSIASKHNLASRCVLSKVTSVDGWSRG